MKLITFSDFYFIVQFSIAQVTCQIKYRIGRRSVHFSNYNCKKIDI